MWLCWAVVGSLAGLSCGSGKPVVKSKVAPVPLKVLLVRHCQYEHRSGKLTATGRGQAEGIAARLKAENVHLILHSPAPRCVETAGIIRKKLGIAAGDSRLTDWLDEDVRGVEVMLEEYLEQNKNFGTLLLVTHQPIIRQLCDKPKATTFGVITRIR